MLGYNKIMGVPITKGELVEEIKNDLTGLEAVFYLTKLFTIRSVEYGFLFTQSAMRKLLLPLFH